MHRFFPHIVGLLLLLLLFQLNGWMLVQKIQRALWQLEIKEVIENEKDKVEVMRFSLLSYQQLEWEKDAHEFWYQGKLYDVISIVRTQNQVIITAFSDTTEVKMLANHRTQTKKFTQSQTSHTLKAPYYIAVYLPAVFQWKHFFAFASQEKLLLTDENSAILCEILPQVPPPKTVISEQLTVNN